jgi:hypothetical protein
LKDLRFFAAAKVTLKARPGQERNGDTARPRLSAALGGSLLIGSRI